MIRSALVVLLLTLPLILVHTQAAGSSRSGITKAQDAWQTGSVEIGPRECIHPNPEDARPYTLCLAETAHAETERHLQIALRNLRAKKGARAASRLQIEQRGWDRQRRRLCASEASIAPTSEFARAEFTCLDRAADSRIAHLTAMTKGS